MAFTTLSHTIQYRGHVFDVSTLHIRLPNGRERDYDLVEHGDSVTVIPMDDDGNIIFVEQHRVGAGNVLLELPAGVIDDGETPLDCAKREIREEIGLGAREMQLIGGFYLAPGYTDEYMTVFLARGLYASPLAPDDDEFIDVVRIPQAEAYQKALNGDIKDGKTLAALLLVQPFFI